MNLYENVDPIIIIFFLKLEIFVVCNQFSRRGNQPSQHLKHILIYRNELNLCDLIILLYFEGKRNLLNTPTSFEHTTEIGKYLV